MVGVGRCRHVGHFAALLGLRRSAGVDGRGVPDLGDLLPRRCGEVLRHPTPAGTGTVVPHRLGQPRGHDRGQRRAADAGHVGLIGRIVDRQRRIGIFRRGIAVRGSGVAGRREHRLALDPGQLEQPVLVLLLRLIDPPCPLALAPAGGDDPVRRVVDHLRVGVDGSGSHVRPGVDHDGRGRGEPGHRFDVEGRLPALWSDRSSVHRHGRDRDMHPEAGLVGVHVGAGEGLELEDGHPLPDPQPPLGVERIEIVGGCQLLRRPAPAGRDSVSRRAGLRTGVGRVGHVGPHRAVHRPNGNAGGGGRGCGGRWAHPDLRVEHGHRTEPDHPGDGRGQAGGNLRFGGDHPDHPAIAEAGVDQRNGEGPLHRRHRAPHRYHEAVRGEPADLQTGRRQPGPHGDQRGRARPERCGELSGREITTVVGRAWVGYLVGVRVECGRVRGIEGDVRGDRGRAVGGSDDPRAGRKGRERSRDADLRRHSGATGSRRRHRATGSRRRQRDKQARHDETDRRQRHPPERRSGPGPQVGCPLGPRASEPVPPMRAVTARRQRPELRHHGFSLHYGSADGAAPPPGSGGSSPSPPPTGSPAGFSWRQRCSRSDSTASCPRPLGS